ncbi:MAG: glycosyltransferase [Actinomycetales bacterium]|nr:glycosyltransferase [Actinomycetales bacterium]
MNAPVGSIAVLVCTYRRPVLLAGLLRSLAAQRTERPFDVIVVDNDPAGSARDVAARAPVPVRYVVEPEPGIAAARNRSLDEAGDVDTVVFVDDDETVEPDWLEALVATSERFDADVVTGPVVAVLPPHAPRWIRRGGFHQRRNLPEGTVLPSAKSGNTLVRTRALGSPPERFDAAFSRSGGSDTDLFWRLARRGARIVWSHDAVASEPVPDSRLTARWLVHREFRGGAAFGRMMLRDSPRPVVLAKGAVRTAVGVVRTLVGTVLNLGPRASDTKVLLFGAGLVASVFGVRTDEYRRGPAAT